MMNAYGSWEDMLYSYRHKKYYMAKAYAVLNLVHMFNIAKSELTLSIILL
jgi:hypothetical protein